MVAARRQVRRVVEDREVAHREMPTPMTAGERENLKGEHTPATQINMDARKPVRKHGKRKYIQRDAGGRTLRVMGENEIGGGEAEREDSTGE
jgi:hypothetical protein